MLKISTHHKNRSVSAANLTIGINNTIFNNLTDVNGLVQFDLWGVVDRSNETDVPFWVMATHDNFTFFNTSYLLRIVKIKVHDPSIIERLKEFDQEFDGLLEFSIFIVSATVLLNKFNK